MWVKDSPKAVDLFSAWHARWRESVAHGMVIDQPPLAAALAEMPVDMYRVLDVKYNAPIEASPYFLCRAKILHYYQSQNKAGKVNQHFRALSSLVRQDPESMKLLLSEIVKNPLKLFSLYESRQFVTQIPVGGAFRLLLFARKMWVARRRN
jgi:hypothetical protein